MTPQIDRRTFAATRVELQRIRQQAEKSRIALVLARENAKKIAYDQAQLERIFTKDNDSLQERRKHLEARRTKAQAEAKTLETSYKILKEAVQDKMLEFAAFTDPRKGVTQLSDKIPILLMPIRIETRFKRFLKRSVERYQLWVRLYPDDIAVDTFEEALSEVEVRNARVYWTDTWRAGGEEDRMRAAWRSLVGSHGSGRAAWILANYRPHNINEHPVKASTTDVITDVILVIPTETPLPQTEIDEVNKYWVAVWRADGNIVYEDAAAVELEAKLGGRASEIITNYRPANMKEKPSMPISKADTVVKVAYLILPKSGTLITKRDSWTQPGHVNVMPERFVLLGYESGRLTLNVVGNLIRSPLVISPDPSAKEGQELRSENGEIIVGDDMMWMIDFQRAVLSGMGFIVDLTDEQYRKGFDRLLVLGVRLAADEMDGKALLEELINHHKCSQSGFSLLPQGTPTNNTEQTRAGFSFIDDPDTSYRDPFVNAPLFMKTSDWLTKKDGQWLAEWLGIEPEILTDVIHAGGNDQAEARAMNVALWPATLGYFMDTMMHPLLNDKTILQARWFFNNLVLGRGLVPAVRKGHQPYGILQTTAFKRLSLPHNFSPFGGLPHPDGYQTFLQSLYNLLKIVEDDWSVLRDKVAHIGKAGDAHQVLLDVIGLHPTSATYYHRYVESLDMHYNILNISGRGNELFDNETKKESEKLAMDLLAHFGYYRIKIPEILEKYFMKYPCILWGPVIDDRPLSDKEKIRNYTPEPNARNYIAWLAEEARFSLDTIRNQDGFDGKKPPIALLYILLRHAVILGYWDASLRLYEGSQVLTGPALELAQQEPKFIHIGKLIGMAESRWKYLYEPEQKITGSTDLLVAEYISNKIRLIPETRYLHEQIEALELLKDAPTARLERTLSEHIDCLSYRLDAWKLGLVGYRLATLRFDADETKVRQGIFLGMYGWLEHVQPENKVLEPVKLEGDLKETFAKIDEPPLFRDASNAGYIPSPSLNQAVTAAVLRNGYIANAAPDVPGALAINLSSERVRRALSILEGIRNGQNLGALLGYQFERGLHDSYKLVEVDEFIYKLRKEFPLVADRFKTTKTEGDVSIKAIEASNVIDGFALVNHINKTGKDEYPFGLKILPQDIGSDESAAVRAAITAEARRICNLHDAVADLAMAEGVHQAVQGNYDRTAATLDAYSKATFPDIPDVVQTPRSGIIITHRVSLHLETGISSNSADITPRAEAEPALNKWLSFILPVPSDIACNVSFIDENGALDEATVTQEDLKLQPIDLLYMLNPESEQAMTALDDQIVRHAFESLNARPDTQVKINYTDRVDGKIPFFEVSALVRSLQAILLRSRPLRPTDISLQGEATSEKDRTLFVDRQRITQPLNRLDDLKKGLKTFEKDLGTLLKAAKKSDIIKGIDLRINDYMAYSGKAAAFGIVQAGLGFAYEWKRNAFSGLLVKLDNLSKDLQGRLEQFDALLSEVAALPADTPDEQRFNLLQQAENLISAKMTIPLPTTTAAYDVVLKDKRVLFVYKKEQFAEIVGNPAGSLAELYDVVQAALPIGDINSQGLDLSGFEEEVVRFAREMLPRANSLAEELSKRIATVDTQFEINDKTSDPEIQVHALVKAAKTMFGEDFQFVPEFALSPEQGDEWEKAYDDKDVLLHHLTSVEDVDFPMDQWLYGIARVREKMHHWENITLLTSAFGKNELELHPIQLSYEASDSWLALAFPEDKKIKGERLLYTAHYATPFDKNTRQCGLLLDEWTEVIPGRDETIGVAFHYDRPSTEPSQVMLLVTPPDVVGNWRWRDLVDALHETLDMAVLRSIEPDHVDDLPYARFLPATVMATTLYPITIAANLALNNQVFNILRKDDNG